MWNLFVFIFSFVFVWLRILKPGGARTIAAENIVLRKQLIALSRDRKRSPKKSGPKGPCQSIIDAIVEMKQRNPSYGHRRIAMQISIVFGVEIDKDVVWRVLNKHYKNNPNDNGPSWLTFISHMKDSLWSIDFFRCESIHLKSYWVMVVLDQFARRIIGFVVHVPTHSFHVF